MAIPVPGCVDTLARMRDDAAMTALSVNVNKIAVLRNSRGHALPDPVEAARVAVAAGCHGITVHPRPDQRHIRSDDVIRIAAALPDNVEFNIEGNPFAGPRDGYPGMLELARRTRPAQVTLVPDGDAQLTSDHGFDLAHEAGRLAPLIDQFRALGCRVSLFVDPNVHEVERAAQMGAQRIEIYTEAFARGFAAGSVEAALADCVATAGRARAAGLAVNAGHDLDQRNLGVLVRAIPFLAEVSIGHALISDALYAGLEATVKSYLSVLASATLPR